MCPFIHLYDEIDGYRSRTTLRTRFLGEKMQNSYVMGGVVDLKPFLERRVPFLSLVLSQITIYYAGGGPAHSFGAASLFLVHHLLIRLYDFPVFRAN